MKFILLQLVIVSFSHRILSSPVDWRHQGFPQYGNSVLQSAHTLISTSCVSRLLGCIKFIDIIAQAQGLVDLRRLLSTNIVYFVLLKPFLGSKWPKCQKWVGGLYDRSVETLEGLITRFTHCSLKSKTICYICTKCAIWATYNICALWAICAVCVGGLITCFTHCSMKSNTCSAESQDSGGEGGRGGEVDIKGHHN